MSSWLRPHEASRRSIVVPCHVVPIIVSSALVMFGVVAGCSSNGGGDDSTSRTMSGDGGDGGSAEDAMADAAEGDASLDAGFACDPSENHCLLSTWSGCVSGQLETEACAYGCAMSGCNTTCDAESEVIDQSVADDFTLIGPWQSFEVDATGVLTSLEIRPNVYSATNDPSSLTLSIYVGEGVSGTRIAQQNYVVPSASGSPLTTFAFTTPVPLQAAQKYTWELMGAKGIHYSKSDTYTHGRASVASYDMVFKAHFKPCH